MIQAVLHGPPSETLKELLEDLEEHDHPAARVMRRLSADLVFARVPCSPYTIAELLAHVNANLQFNLALLESGGPTSFINPFETTSYHLGQIDLLRRLLNAWPPA